MKVIIGVMGFARSGKDTTAEILVRKYGFTRMGFADQLRRFALACDPIIYWSETGTYHRLSDVVEAVGWDTAKDEYPEVRRLLQKIGTEGGREIFGETAWVDALFRSVPEDVERLVVPDTRFFSEYEGIHNLGGEVWRVTRPGYGPLNDHASEMEQINIPEDHIVLNDGDLIDLEAHIDMLAGTCVYFS